MVCGAFCLRKLSSVEGRSAPQPHRGGTRCDTRDHSSNCKAIADHGSAAYTPPPGAVLDLMTQLAPENDLESFARAFAILARAKPTNAAFVAVAVPAKISD